MKRNATPRQQHECYATLLSRNVGICMPEEWDTGLKLLIGEKPQDFISWLVPGAKYRKVVSPHLPGRKIDADSLFEIILNGKAMLFHIEFQSYRDLSIVKRLWEYNVRATLKYKLPVLSFVFYLKREKKPAESPYIWELPNGEVIHRFQFAVGGTCRDPEANWVGGPASTYTIDTGWKPIRSS